MMTIPSIDATAPDLGTVAVGEMSVASAPVISVGPEIQQAFRQAMQQPVEDNALLELAMEKIVAEPLAVKATASIPLQSMEARSSSSGASVLPGPDASVRIGCAGEGSVPVSTEAIRPKTDVPLQEAGVGVERGTVPVPAVSSLSSQPGTVPVPKAVPAPVEPPPAVETGRVILPEDGVSSSEATGASGSVPIAVVPAQVASTGVGEGTVPAPAVSSPSSQPGTVPTFSASVSPEVVVGVASPVNEAILHRHGEAVAVSVGRNKPFPQSFAEPGKSLAKGPLLRSELTRRVEPMSQEDAGRVIASGVMRSVVMPPVMEAVVPTANAQPISSVDIVRASVENVATASSAPVLMQAANAVADTLLVTPGLLRGQGEIRIQLRPDVLEGTEIRISVVGRQLEVQFNPQSQDMAVLIEQCRPQLEQHLAGKIRAFQISVDVRRKRDEERI